MLLFFRYEDEINKRTDCENNFVLIKKVCLSLYIPDNGAVISLCYESAFNLLHININQCCIYHHYCIYRAGR